VLALVVLVVSVGLADSVNPSTLAPAFLIATGAGAVRRLTGFTAGVFAVSFAGGALLVLGPGQLLLGALPHPSRHTKAIAEIVGGLVLIGLAAALWAGRRKVAARMSASSGSSSADRGAFALGAGIMAVELPTALPYLGAIAAIIASDVHPVGAIGLVLLYNVAFVSPLLAMTVARRFAGEGTATKLEVAGDWLRERGPGLLALLLGAAGVAVAVWGVAKLA
jgi:cytochrome c biogenesis protein CcdA